MTEKLSEEKEYWEQPDDWESRRKAFKKGRKPTEIEDWIERQKERVERIKLLTSEPIDRLADKEDPT